jgi:hypothetical protein
MNFATRFGVIGIAVLGFALCAATAQADSYSFSISGSGITASGLIFVATTATPGVDEITGITGSFSDGNVGGFSGAIVSLIAGSYSASAPTTISETPGSGLSNTFDNLFYPGGAAAPCAGGTGGGVLDLCGLAFVVGTNDDVNLFGTGSGVYGLSDWTPSSIVQTNVPVSATFTAPEPGTLSLILIGLIAVGLISIRKRKILLV